MKFIMINRRIIYVSGRQPYSASIIRAVTDSRGAERTRAFPVTL